MMNPSVGTRTIPHYKKGDKKYRGDKKNNRKGGKSSGAKDGDSENEEETNPTLALNIIAPSLRMLRLSRLCMLHPSRPAGSWTLAALITCTTTRQLCTIFEIPSTT